MAVITNYTTLQTAVGDYLARSDLTTFLPNFVQNWEERFYRDSSNWYPDMEVALNVTISGGVAALPTGYLGLVQAYIDGTGAQLKRVNLDQLYARYPRGLSSGHPLYIARNRNQFEFGPEPDGTYTVLGTYYRKPDTLRADGDGVNWLITNAPDLCLYGSLLEAEPFLKNDSRIPVWQSFYNDSLAAFRSQHIGEMHSGSAPAVVVG